jgi:hypothetical protein
MQVRFSQEFATLRLTLALYSSQIDTGKYIASVRGIVPTIKTKRMIQHGFELAVELLNGFSLERGRA